MASCNKPERTRNLLFGLTADHRLCERVARAVVSHRKLALSAGAVMRGTLCGVPPMCPERPADE